MKSQLTDFIAHARGKGMDHSTIRMLLLSAGWKEKDISQGLTAESLDMPVPTPPDTGGARDAFYHLLTFSCFYTALISVFILLFTYINHWLPDAATDPASLSYDFGSIRWSLAALFVTFPLYAWLSRKLLGEAQMHGEKARSAVRRWLTYLTLFLTALAIIADVITLLYQLLQGELTLRFILKVCIVFALSGATFFYYFKSLTTQVDRQFHRVFALVAAVVVLITLVWGLLLVGSPMSERLKKFDDRRVSDFQSINNEMMTYVVQYNSASRPSLKRALPKTLTELAVNASYQRLSLDDPQTGVPYEYAVTGTTTYQLCALFTFERREQYDVRWDHPAGYYCYTFDVLSDDMRGTPVKPMGIRTAPEPARPLQ